MLFVFIFLLLLLSGCKGISPSSKQNDVYRIESKIEENDEDFIAKSKEMASSYQEVYQKAKQENTLASLDTMKRMIACLGASGYVAVDVQNQVNMTNANDVKDFIREVEEKKNAEITIISVLENGGFIRYDLQSTNGEVLVTSSYLCWNNNRPEVNEKEEYMAYTWKYSEDGYLFFEQYHMPGYDGPSGHTALRVEPLDERCREYNQKYIYPIGYGSNNMFITDWNENDYAELDFDDLFPILYPMVYGTSIPYEMTYEGELYDIDRDEFETVIQSCFNIGSELLRGKTTYREEDGIYEYRTRGFNDLGWTPNIPYPEVVQYEENLDGTVKLTVHVVYPEENVSCAFSHEVLIRPLSNEHVQYVSNYIIPSKQNMEPTWYVNKMTEDDRKKYFLE